jgi:V8-like Glu-specific endopeptidase
MINLLRKIAFIFSTLFLLTSASANQKVVYGEDDRLDLFEVTNSMHLKLAKSTAAMIPNRNVSIRNDVATLRGGTLEGSGICSDAKFAKQITPANCSGFLVGEDLLVTAGHCISSESKCRSYKWVFDFAVEQAGDAEGSFKLPSSQVYGCKEIVEQEYGYGTSDDYALIRLDRKVTDRDPLEVRTSGKVKTGTDLLVIGHPTGLPSKVAGGAWVRDNSNKLYFSSNLDTFGGNSGSAVFDAATGVVEGILVRGERDYKTITQNGKRCRVPNTCTDKGCRGEDVTRITNIKKLMAMFEE